MPEIPAACGGASTPPLGAFIKAQRIDSGIRPNRPRIRNQISAIPEDSGPGNRSRSQEQAHLSATETADDFSET